MILYALMPVCPANPYLRHLTQYFVGKHPIIGAEAHSISDWGFQIADFGRERVCERDDVLEEHFKKTILCDLLALLNSWRIES